MAAPRVLNFCIFGAGRAGSIHMKNIHDCDQSNLLYIVDDIIERANEVAAKYPGCTALHVNDADRALNDPNLHAVMVASPTSSHHEWVTRSLRAGKDVFCEKPIALSNAEIAACYDEAARCGRRLFCAFNRRFDPSFAKVRQSVLDGGIGKPHIIRVTSRDSPIPPPIAYLRISGGMNHDCSIHDIDMVCWVLGERPVSIFCNGSAFYPEIAEMGDVDTVTMSLKFPSGALATIDVSRLSIYGYDQRLEVYGDQGMVQAENRTPTSFAHSNLTGKHTDRIYMSFPQRYNEGYMAELCHFIESIKDRSVTVGVSKEDCLYSTVIADAANESMKSGKVVTISYPAC